MKLPAELPPENVVAVIDTREQLPLDLSPLRIWPDRVSLPTADYSVKGLEHLVAIERKSLDDLLTCCGRERDRFDREIQRLLAFPTRCIVVESTWPEIEAGGWRAHVTPKCVRNSLISWMARGIPVLLSGDHERAGRDVARLLYSAANHRYQQLRALLGGKRGFSPEVAPGLDDDCFFAQKAESAAVGALIVNPTHANIDAAAKIIQPKDFLDPLYAGIFATILDLRAAGKPFDGILLFEACKSRPECAGEKLAYEFSRALVPVECKLLLDYCRAVADASRRRQLALTVGELDRAVRDPSKPIDNLAAEFMGQLVALEIADRGTQCQK